MCLLLKSILEIIQAVRQKAWRESMGEEYICDWQRKLQATRLFVTMLQDKEKKNGVGWGASSGGGAHWVSFETWKLMLCRNKRESDQLGKHGGHKLRNGPIRKCLQ